MNLKKLSRRFGHMTQCSFVTLQYFFLFDLCFKTEWFVSSGLLLTKTTDYHPTVNIMNSSRCIYGYTSNESDHP